MRRSQVVFGSLISTFVAFIGLPLGAAEEAQQDEGYMEEVIVTGERGEVNVMDRPMTVTGFNQAMIEQLGMQTINDLEVLVPGLQVGNRSQGGGKMENDHFYMRGIGSERSVNFFSDTSVAVYIDGVWTDQTYGTDGFFDVERVEVARGPQGTTGGRAAMSGAINFHTRKPTDEFDIRVDAELTDVSTNRTSLAFGGPINDSGFSYRFAAQRFSGDGYIENLGSGPDAGEPDRTRFAPSLRWKNDRWDIVARYSNQKDTGTPRSSLPLGGRNTQDEFVMNAATGQCLTYTDPVSGAEICQRNPFYGVPAAPAVAGCSNINNDGSRDEMNIICNPDELRWEISSNTQSMEDSSAENFSIDVSYIVNDNYRVNYKFGSHDVSTRTINDSDQLNQQGGGTCLAGHPKVLPISAIGGWVQLEDGSWTQPLTPVLDADGNPVPTQLQAGQSSRYCSQDGGGVGAFTDASLDAIFTSDQTSHEVTLISTLDGPFNFSVGFTTMDGDEPNVYSGRDHSSYEGDWLYTDTSAACNAALAGLYGSGGSLSGGDSWLLRDLYTDAAAMSQTGSGGNLYACPGSAELVGFSDTGRATFLSNPDGESWAFYGNMEYESTGIYFNADYVVNDEWSVFGGIRHDSDDKGRTESSYADLIGIQADGTACGDTNWENCFSIVGIGVRDGSVDNYAGRGDLNWSATTWNVGTEFRPSEEVMIYGRISTGYRAGGSLGYGNSQAPWQFDSEEMINYEVGVKGLYFDRTLQLQATYFLQDFDSYWVFASRLKTEAEKQMEPFASPLTGEVNPIGGTTIGGIELDAAWRINDSFTLRGFYNYLNSDIGDYDALYPYAIPGQAGGWVALPWTDSEGNAQNSWIFGSADPVQYGGNQLVNQPQHKGSLTLVYETELPGEMGSLEVLTIANYRSEKFVEPLNLDAYAIDSYTRWDLRANWRSQDAKWTVTAYIQNLLDEAALQMWSPREGIGSPWGTIVEPRQVGFSFSWQN